MKLLAGLIISLFAIVGIVWGIELNKQHWDEKVRDLCMTEGGVTIYEAVELADAEYALYAGEGGGVMIPNEATPGAARYNYLTKWTVDIVRERAPSVTRDEFTVYRRSDEKVLGKLVTFARIGGDFPVVIAAPSSFSCLQIAGFESDLERKVLLPAE